MEEQSDETQSNRASYKDEYFEDQPKQEFHSKEIRAVTEQGRCQIQNDDFILISFRVYFS